MNMSRNWKWFTKDDIDSWPDNHKRCRKCNEIKLFSDFHKNENGKQLFGLASDCKQCRKEKSKSDWAIKKKNVKKIILDRARSRAIKNKINFSINESDIVIPEKCPIFNHEFIVGDVDWTYSIDRIDPNKGYSPENIIIVSNKANRIKNNATPDEIIAVGEFYKRLV